MRVAYNLFNKQGQEALGIHEIRVYQDDGDTLAHDVERQAAHDGIDVQLATTKIYYVEDVTDAQARQLAGQLLSDPVTQSTSLAERIDWHNEHRVEIAPLPGSTNPVVGSMRYAANLLGIHPTGLQSGTEYRFDRTTPPEVVHKTAASLLLNETVDQVRTRPPNTLVIEGYPGSIETVPVRNLSDDKLLELSKQRSLALNLKEMKYIRDNAVKINRDMTDGEVEYPGAAWSEHCCHKTTNAPIIRDGLHKPSIMNRIQACSTPYFDERGVLSAFSDNSGVFRFYDGQAINIKLETHNSPRGIHPKSGAATGTGGVLRDINKTGTQGARPINSMHMDFIAAPDLPEDEIPPGTLSPKQLLRGSVAGVGGYGNPMGIPTNNGSLHINRNYRGKSSILVGSMGMMPEVGSQQGHGQFGDLVVAIGGMTGRDGIHGATFSSIGADAETGTIHSSAVQNGDPITEKKMFDAVLEAGSKGLIRAMTDCGAAGFASAIGELGEDIGVRVDLIHAPLKYAGLQPWEIFLSESQERGVLAIDPKHIDEVKAIFAKHESDATVLGIFGTPGEPRLEVLYDGQSLVDLDYAFIKGGRKSDPLEAHWRAPIIIEKQPDKHGWEEIMYGVLSDWNVCSKEVIVRRYDQEVGGASAMKSYAGVHNDAPNNAAVMTPILGKPYAVVQAHGCNPSLTDLDPRLGSVWSYAEGMSNFVAVGGNPDDAIIVNNYISAAPNPQVIGALDMSVDALSECVHEFRSPIISGKDSLSSTYKFPDGTILESPYNLIITVAGKIPDVAKTISTDIKQPGSTLVLIGKPDYESFGGSVYYDNFGGASAAVPRIDVPVFHQTCTALHKAIQTDKVMATHDVSEGGLAVTVSEMLFGGDCGAELAFDTSTAIENIVFNETAGCFVVEVQDEQTANELFGAIPHQIIGKTIVDKKLRVSHGSQELPEIDIDVLKNKWKAPLEAVFS